jgi:hypothetical protein
VNPKSPIPVKSSNHHENHSLHYANVLKGCGSKPGTGDDATDSGVVTDSGDTDTDTDTGTEADTPKDGLYTAAFKKFTQDECNLEDELKVLLDNSVSLEFMLAKPEMEGQIIMRSDSSDLFPCVLKNLKFTCPVDEDADEFEHLNATIIKETSITGIWLTNESIEGALEFSVICKGSEDDCAYANKILADEGESFSAPCSTSVFFEGSWQN